MILQMIDISSFLEIEKKYHLYEASIQGINFWVYERFELWDKYILNGNGQKPEKKARKPCKTYLQLIKSVVFPGRLKNAGICFISHERRVRNGVFFESVYTDQLVERYPDAIVLEKPYTNEMKHFQPVKYNSLYYMDNIMVVGKVRAILYRKFLKRGYLLLCGEVRKHITEPVKEIESAYHISLNVEKLVNETAEKILLCRFRYPMLERIIKKINPKVIIETVSYAMDRMIINEIAEKMGIITIELQHGVMHKEHGAYQYSNGMTVRQFPQKIFLFSEYCKNIAQLPISKENQIVTGFPYFERKKKEYENKRYNHQKKRVLFISQITVGEELSRLACDLEQRIDHNEYQIIYKLHPAEYTIWKERYSYLTGINIQVIDNNKTDLYELFATCQYQVGVYSTAIFEGLGFGLKTYILETGRSDIMKDLCNMRFADMVSDAEELKRKLELTEESDISVMEFWKENALQNMVSEIENCLSD